MVDPAQVSEQLRDGMCACRGCKAARKRVVSDLKSLLTDEQSLTILSEYWEKNK